MARPKKRLKKRKLSSQLGVLDVKMIHPWKHLKSLKVNMSIRANLVREPTVLYTRL